jgi:hypothetical protein
MADEIAPPQGVRRFRRSRGQVAWLWVASQLFRHSAGFLPRTKCLWIGVGEPGEADLVEIRKESERLREVLTEFIARNRVRTPRSCIQGTIYFARCGENIKIGFSGGARSRLSDLQAGNPEPIELIGWMPGPPQVERSLHRRFAKLRVRREWFRATPALLQFIGSVTPPGEPSGPRFNPPAPAADGPECFD